ncbi:MAG TPA: DNA polymerase I [Candidatus Saccharimonadales bacterium]|nr:DNA polymerase I [Candidatus Saccharimonadales bacterium]
MATLYLVDGTYNIFRAYHATPPLATSAGLPTNAVYAFTTMLRKLLADERPSYLAVAFDTEKPTFRHEAFEEYKAHRPPPPDDLVPQFEYVRKVCEVLRVAVVDRDGWEADDVIATLAEKATAEGHEAVIVTADKDLFQLVRPGVKILNPHKGDLLMDAEKVEEVFGVAPGRVVEVLALMGDASDNVPGVPGIGEKGAREIVRRFGTIEEAVKGSEEDFAALGRMGKRYFKNLRENLGLARKCRDLVTVRRDAPVELDLALMKVREPDRRAAYDLFTQLEFERLLDHYAPEGEGQPITETITSIAELARVLKEARDRGLLSIDTETTSPDPMRAALVGVSLCSTAGSAAYVPVGHAYIGAPAQLATEEVVGALKPLLEDAALPKVGQNIKYDLIVLARHGSGMEGIGFDTMIASYLVDPSRRQHNMDVLARDYLGYKTITYEEIAGSGAKQVTLDGVDVETVARYAGEDAEVALRLRDVLAEKLRERELDELFESMELPLIPVLARMEMAGVKVDTDFLASMSKDMQKDLARLESEIHELAGVEFNINSPKQLADILFGKLEMKSRRKTAKSKAMSTSQEVLEQLAEQHPLPRKVLDYRSLAKLKGTYVDALPQLVNPETGRVHTSFNQAVAATGRLSSTDPNLQNIPARTELGRRIRGAFVPEKGCLFLSADYSQVELRLLAHMADDPDMQDAFRRGEDIHRRTAAQIFGVIPELVTDDMRRQAKTINFGVLYGMGPVRLARELSIPRKQATEFIEQYFARFPRVKQYMDATIEGLHRDGYVSTLFNRRRWFPEIRSGDRMLIQQALRAAVNTTLQGTAADIIKRAMIAADEALRKRKLGTRMLLQVHDELLLEVPEDEMDAAKELIRDCMEGACELSVPLVVDMKAGRSWQEVT